MKFFILFLDWFNKPAWRLLWMGYQEVMQKKENSIIYSKRSNEHTEKSVFIRLTEAGIALRTFAFCGEKVQFDPSWCVLVFNCTHWTSDSKQLNQLNNSHFLQLTDWHLSTQSISQKKKKMWKHVSNLIPVLSRCHLNLSPDLVIALDHGTPTIRFHSASIPMKNYSR